MAGAKGIVLVATNADKLRTVEADLNSKYPEVQSLAVVTDISNAASVESLFEKVKAKFGHADVLVNNAGLHSGGGNIHEEDPKKWWSNFVSELLYLGVSPVNALTHDAHRR
jgi:NADP-dependent 3-hydroxy acid dehydrogenase YdfG